MADSNPEAKGDYPEAERNAVEAQIMAGRKTNAEGEYPDAEVSTVGASSASKIWISEASSQWTLAQTPTGLVDSWLVTGRLHNNIFNLQYIIFIFIHN